MKFLFGFFFTLGMVLGGYVLHHGKLGVLWQPTEFMIILGAAIGSFVIGCPGHLIKAVLKNMKRLMKGAPYHKKDYIELLTLLYETFKLMRSKGMLEIESHIENPSASSLFSKYPKFMKSHHAVHFLCDHLRIMTMGVENYYTLEELMERELEVHHKEAHHVSHTIVNFADAMPALGIVAAVLGVIVTMGSLHLPAKDLGPLIGAALVGTFLGVLLSYAYFAPMGRHIGEHMEAEVRYMDTIKVALLAHVKGNAPALSVEFARTSLDLHDKPEFSEVENACSSI